MFDGILMFGFASLCSFIDGLDLTVKCNGLVEEHFKRRLEVKAFSVALTWHTCLHQVPIP